MKILKDIEKKTKTKTSEQIKKPTEKKLTYIIIRRILSLYTNKTHVMKKITLFMIVLLSILVFNPTILLADAANIIFAPGGNVKMINNKFVKMKNEQIYITICEDKCKYRGS